jgi:dihydropteroate synthase
MGVLNVTPDSFSDGGQWLGKSAAIDHALAMQEAGADIIDIGGESTRPGAQAVSLQQELDRVLPVIEAIAANLSIPVSIDTSKPAVMRAAVHAGAGMLNDVYALRMQGAVEAAAELAVPVCAEVRQFLLQRASECEAAGISQHNILLDPGFGFGKTLQHNTELFHSLPELVSSGYPVLVGVSRKAMIGALTGRDVSRRTAGSISAAVLAAQAGAAIIRVHDVAETRDALKVATALWQGWA